MLSSRSGGLLLNYLNDASWFGEVSGTAVLTAAAYRMAVNDPGTFGQSYISWADANRKSLAQYESGGIFAPTVDPYSWENRTPFTSGSPEGQAFTVYLYTAYRDCVSAGICAQPSPVTTISHSGIGPIDVITRYVDPLSFSAVAAPTGVTCNPSQSCDADGCSGAFKGIAVNPVCTAGESVGCPCKPTDNTCGPHQSCDLNGCAGAYDGIQVGLLPFHGL
jgi:hypothetical protein